MSVPWQVSAYYESGDEGARLWQPGQGELTRLRTWDIFERYLPPSGRIADIGGGPGTHARHLAGRGYDVVLIDPVPRHIEQAGRDGAEHGYTCQLGDARALPLADASVDVALLLGPLYHLAEALDRQQALREASRVLRPGGRLLAEVITRHAWIIDATRRGLLAQRDLWDVFALNLRAGLSNHPEAVTAGTFWGYFHTIEELAPEVEQAGFGDVALVAVEGFAGLLGNLEQLLTAPQDLLRVCRLTEREPSQLGVSPHVIVAATRPAA